MSSDDAIESKHAVPFLAVPLALILLCVTPSALGSELPTGYILVGGESANCPSGEAACMLEDPERPIYAGHSAGIVLQNNASEEHGVVVVDADRVEAGNGSTATEVLEEVPPVEPGQADDEIIQLPEGIEQLYIYCPLDDHEQRGEHVVKSVRPSEEYPEPSGARSDQIPTPGLLGGLLGLAVAGGLVSRE